MAVGEFYAMEYDAWDEGTVGLTLEEEAAFLRICHQIYRRRQPIPNNDRLLCALWRCHQNKARPLLQRLIAKGKITLTEDGRITNDRAAKELDVRETLRRRKADAGHTGGIRSGEARRKPLENNDPPEAKRTTGQDRTGHNKTKKVEAELPLDPTPRAKVTSLKLPIAKDATISAYQIHHATQNGFTEERARYLFGRFKDHHQAKGNKFASWDAAWRTWISNEIKFTRPDTGGRSGDEYRII